ncbi:LysR family transcriptional regulator [Kineococcus terrestris]|uniref:LysR family transcriptional regulator n=1 Tax=Kineococcus terrestris TaxID=2044856 RepID=UPI0034DB27B7
MELRQLEHFVAVVDGGGFTAAAAHLRVAQPGVSVQVRKLEREVGQPLLERTPRGVRLTAAGEAALPHARAALAAAAAVREHVAELSGLLRGSLRVGLLLASAPEPFTGVLRAFRERAPGVELTVVEADAAALQRAVLDGSLDVAWVATGPGTPAGLTGQVLAEEEVVAVLAAGALPPRRRTTPLVDLLEHPLVCPPRGGGIRAVLEEACAAAGLVPRVAVEASSPATAVELAAGGLGAALVPASLAAGLDPARCGVLRVVRPALRARVQLVRRAGTPAAPAVREFWRLARAAG